jgi:hypothetical protein
MHEIKKEVKKNLAKIYALWVRKINRKLSIEVPKEYQDFETLFQEEEEGKLPESRDWDYKIEIKEGKEIKPLPLYPIS